MKMKFVILLAVSLPLLTPADGLLCNYCTNSRKFSKSLGLTRSEVRPPEDKLPNCRESSLVAPCPFDKNANDKNDYYCLTEFSQREELEDRNCLSIHWVNRYGIPAKPGCHSYDSFGQVDSSKVCYCNTDSCNSQTTYLSSPTDGSSCKIVSTSLTTLVAAVVALILIR